MSQGSGKSTLGRALIGLLPSTGRIVYKGQDGGITDKRRHKLKKDVPVVFQDPYGSLSPRMTVGEIITESNGPSASPLQQDRSERARKALIGWQSNSINRYPHEFSGGQRQRIAIARALILRALFHFVR